MKETKTAFHEAGHVIMCIEGGLSFEYVTIEETETTVGHVWRGATERSIDSLSLDVFTSEIAMMLGGIIAEDECGLTSNEEKISGSRFDMLAALKAVWIRENQNKKDTLKFFEPILPQVEETIKRRWPEVEKIAAALISKHTLTFKEVIDLLSISEAKKAIERGREIKRKLADANAKDKKQKESIPRGMVRSLSEMNDELYQIQEQKKRAREKGGKNSKRPPDQNMLNTAVQILMGEKTIGAWTNPAIHKKLRQSGMTVSLRWVINRRQTLLDTIAKVIVSGKK